MFHHNNRNPKTISIEKYLRDANIKYWKDAKGPEYLYNYIYEERGRFQGDMDTCLSYLSKLITLYKFGSPSRVAWTPFTTLWAIYSEDIPMPFITPCLLFNIFFSLTRKGKLYHPPTVGELKVCSITFSLWLAFSLYMRDFLAY